MDGNGRLHRHLIHESLTAAGFTPKGIILPVSTVILSNLDRYKATLETFSRRLRSRTSFEWMTDAQVLRFESIVARSFALDIDPEDIVLP